MSDINSDKILLKRLKEDDESALTTIYNKYWKPLYNSAFNVLKNKELSEDVVQNIFISLWNNRKKLTIKVSLKSYLYTSTRYQVFAIIRKNKSISHIQLLDDLDNRIKRTSPETELMFKELVAQINTVVDSLPDKCRKVYKLSREKQLSHKEISLELNISTKTVENHISKALKTLKASLGYLADIFLFFLLSN